MSNSTARSNRDLNASQDRSAVVPQPRSSQDPIGGEHRTALDEHRYLLTERHLLILVIAFVVGLLAGVAAGVSVAVQAQASLGTGPCVLLGIASGLVTMTMASLAVAKTLHKLLR
ncbi:hypothetical protein ACPB67_14695 [Micromonospora taraxaci]|uniref:hypothetical protein n=1 Tax=Micromonospora taraxaci TaxID=1316803 RepID=UPI003C2DCBC1